MGQQKSIPAKQGLYDPRFEHDACGIGFVANIKGVTSNSILRQGLTILLNLDHRGARGAEENTGDGAGILIQVPHKFFRKACSPLGIDLPEPGNYGVGMVFLPPDPEKRRECEKIFETITKEEGQTLLGWRTVPTNDSSLGETAKIGKPYIRQVFIKGEDLSDARANGLELERKLYIIRKKAEKAIRYSGLAGGDFFYIPSLSGKTIVYKGMLTPEQVSAFYPELDDPAMETALALVHSRFSTNTFPSWERAHPNRYLIHNGEINTLRGNINWMYARESAFKSSVFGERISDVLPVIDADGSDSSMLDNSLEALYLSGWSLPHAMMMMIPEPYTKNKEINDELRAFYEYHSCLMEPWDGPAAVAFTDGTRVGAVLDRNGLRPSRYYVTKNDLVIMASEVGVVDLPAEEVLYKGRLQAGRMLLVDTEEGRIISDQELKDKLAKEHPYQEWVDKYLLTMNDLSDIEDTVSETEEQVMPLVQRQKAFGYTYEEMRKVLIPMATDGVEPIGAMGTDTPLAVLSDKPQLLYDYFKQLFAQVTNPPIDAIREDIVTSTEIFIGSEGNLLEPEPENCRQLKLEHPILSDQELAKLRKINSARRCGPGFGSVTLSTLYNTEEEGAGLKEAMDRLYREAKQSIADGANILILSDRGINKEKSAIPCLLAVSGLHHYLIREKLRTRVSLVIESGEPREVHHFALLLGYGASAVNPYLAFESVRDLVESGLLPDIGKEKAVKNYIKALVKGVIKVLSKMGISTVQSYQGAQIFEAVGISQEVIDNYFTWTPSRVGGIGLDIIASEARMRHESAFRNQDADHTLEPGGVYQWRKNGEHHIYNPETIHKIQEACRKGDYELYKAYSTLISEDNQVTFRRLFKLKTEKSPAPLEEVESVESICRRFKTGAMSYGSISKEAHEALAIAMNRIGGKSNTGEGGEDATRFISDPNGDSRCSAIKQVASGRFGVTIEYLNNAEEIQIKIAQGAKPGEGGQLPGKKVYPWVAKVRHSTPGVGLISPPPHHDIYSIEDLAELIYDLKNANRQARISVKLVSEVGVGTIAAGVAKGGADVILISGFDGGTGASPRTSIRHAGLPWELGLAETHQTLLLNKLRSRVVLETDGKLMNGRDVVIAALLGAEEYGFATLPLVTLGCVMMRVCNLDTCPVGVATQNPELRKRFTGDPQYVVNLMKFIAREMREIMAELGFRTVEEMIGRVDKIELRADASEVDAAQNLSAEKIRTLDLSNILYQPEVPMKVGRARSGQEHSLDDTFDKRVLLNTCEPALTKGERVRAILPIKNTDRVVGTILGSEVYRRFGKDGLAEDTIHLHLKGSAGQSFGAFLPPGITMTLEGDANDYIGKGLSGGKIIVYPSESSHFAPEENVIIGNVAFYGATGGEAYIYGMAGERFCVRNSGVKAVVESVGDHGCEYMTGGRVIVLGSTGRNFAAGMTGGIAYIYDEHVSFEAKCNKEMVDLEPLTEKNEVEEIKRMIKRHLDYTGSEKAKVILAEWPEAIGKFVRVIPKDYKRMLQVLKQVQESGLGGDEAAMAAFEQNKSDLKRVSGN